VHINKSIEQIAWERMHRGRPMGAPHTRMANKHGARNSISLVPRSNLNGPCWMMLAASAFQDPSRYPDRGP